MRRQLSPWGSADLIQALDQSGRHGLARACLEYWLGGLHDDGSFTPDGTVGGHASLLQGIASHIWMTGDKVWCEANYESIWSAAHWLASRPPDADGSLPELTRVVAAHGSMAELAALLEREDDAVAFRFYRDEARDALLERFAATVPAEGWTSAVLDLDRRLPDALPVDELSASSEVIAGLCRRADAAQAEGVSVEGGHLAIDETARLARVHALRGEQRDALSYLYGILLHTGACHEGFGTGVGPWASRDGGPHLTPDIGFTAAYMTLLRDLLVRESGDQLHLFSALSPEWARPGEIIGVEAATQFGKLSAAMDVREAGAEFAIGAVWHAAPSTVVLHLPYFANVTRATADRPGLRHIKGDPASSASQPDISDRNEWLEMAPDTTRVTIEWEIDDTEPFSYEQTVSDWRAAYGPRYDEHIATGGNPTSLAPIPLR